MVSLIENSTFAVTTGRKRRILICCISPADKGLFVPLIYGNLRSWCEQFGSLNEGFEWLDPIMLPVDFENLNNKFNFSTVDILGISCYQWNYAYHYDLAAYIKAINPKCVVIAGGPHVDYRHPDYFSDHPYIDFVVSNEGEIPFQLILIHLKGLIGLDDVEGVYVNPRLGQYQFHPAPEIDLATRPSPWLSLKAFWTDYYEKFASYRLAVSFESSRGCPYGCTYCDWGGSSNLKVRFVSTETAKEELRFIQGTLKPTFMFWADGNLGIAKRDVELVEFFSNQKKKTGSPQWLYYNCNKNDIVSNVQIAERLRQANLLTKYVLAVQHMDPEVLRAIKRVNLPKKQILQVVKQLKEQDCPIFVQLIAGCPGDTFEKWLNSFSSLMDMGIHGEYRVYPFSFLPNSPAALPEYCNEWKLDILERPDYVAYFNLRDQEKNWALSKSRYVVGSKTLNRNEYVKTLELGCLIMALHDHGFTRRIAIALNDMQMMNYSTFYRNMYSLFFENEIFLPISLSIHEHFQNWICDENAAMLVYNNSIEGMIEPEEALVWKIFEHFDYFFAELKSYLHSQQNVPERLLDYQRDILYRPEFRPNEKEIFSSKWACYFDPSLNRSGVYQLDISALSFKMPLWYKIQNTNKRLRAFYSQIIQHNIPGSERTIFKKLQNQT